MSTRFERPLQRHFAHPEEHSSAGLPNDLLRPTCRFASTSSPLDECVGAISLVDVTLRSLDSQDIAAPEQEVLKRALQALWSVHNWIYDRSWPETAVESASERGCRA